MRKVVIITLSWIIGIIAVLAIILFTLLQIRAKRADHILVSSDASSLLIVETDAILKDIALNALVNPFTYLKKDSAKKDDKEIEWLNSGVSIPARLVFFNTELDSSTFYTLLDVSNDRKFQKLTRTIPNLEISAIDDGLTYGQVKSGQLNFVFDDQQVLFCVSKNSKGRPSDLLNVWKDKDSFVTYSTVKDKMSDKTSGADVKYVQLNGNGFLTMNFKNGRIDINGELKNLNFQPSPNPAAYQFEDNLFLGVQLNAYLPNLLDIYEKYIGKVPSQIDSIRPYLGDYLQLEWTSDSVSHRDTVITYAYDDNFEMKEQAEIIDVKVPDIDLTIKASPHILSYLPEKMFYKFDKGRYEDLIFLRTDFKKTGIAKRQNSDDFFKLYFRPSFQRKLLPNLPIFDVINDVSFVASQRDKEGVIHVDGHIQLANDRTNSLYQMLTAF